MVSIGIDPSINSTGACVWCDGQVKHYIIGSKPTKTTLKYCNDNNIPFIDYGKNLDKKILYYEKELVKTENLITLANYIKFLVYDNEPDVVVMEGVSYGSTSGSSLVDLAGLNFLFRKSILDHCQNLVVASPMEIKKFATGNGGVNKDVMIHVWRECMKMPDPGKAKIDDVSDAYFMALYGVCQMDPTVADKIVFPKVLDSKNSDSRKSKKKKSDDTDDDVIRNFSEITI